MQQRQLEWLDKPSKVGAKERKSWRFHCRWWKDCQRVKRGKVAAWRADSSSQIWIWWEDMQQEMKREANPFVTKSINHLRGVRSRIDQERHGEDVGDDVWPKGFKEPFPPPHDHCRDDDILTQDIKILCSFITSRGIRHELLTADNMDWRRQGLVNNNR